MAYRLFLKSKAEKELNKLPRKDYLRISATMIDLAANPYLGKKLEGELTGLYSYRVWPYRIIYQIRARELIVLVVDIGHRQGVYKN